MAPHVDGAELSFLIYLDTLNEGNGGETSFPQLNVKFRPVQGDALMWRTPAADKVAQFGESRHEGLPVNKGLKYVLAAHFNLLTGSSNDTS